MLLLILLLAMSADAGTPPAEPAGDAEPLALETGEFDPAAWDRLVATHVRRGFLDFAGVTPGEIASLDAFLEAAGEHKLTATFGKEPRAAFLANAYNAWAARQILAHPKAETLSDIPGFFDGNAIRIAGEERTLNDIEAMLPKVYPESPLVLFTLAPGGAGYPLLPARAYTGTSLVELNREVFREYIERPEFGMSDPGGEVRLPAGIERHRAWFEETPGGIPGVIGTFLTVSTVIALSSPETALRFPDTDDRIAGRDLPPRENPPEPADGDDAGW